MNLDETSINFTDYLRSLGGRKRKRAGITTSKGRGQSKARRKMAKASRRKNRGQ